MQRHHAETQLNDPAALAVAMAAAGRRAGTLARRISDPARDLEDHCQDILVDLISRAARFDPARGSWGAFVTVVTRNAARGMLARYGSVTVVGADVDAFVDDRHADVEAACAFKLDTAMLLHRLPPPLLPILMGVAVEVGVTDAQRASGMPAASFYRALRQLRLRLIAGGLAPRSFIDNRRLAASGR